VAKRRCARSNSRRRQSQRGFASAIRLEIESCLVGATDGTVSNNSVGHGSMELAEVPCGCRLMFEASGESLPGILRHSSLNCDISVIAGGATAETLRLSSVLFDDTMVSLSQEHC
jgi:hypothetical protein